MSLEIPLADRAEIADLFARLARLLDERRHDDAATVFSDGFRGRSPHGELRGLAELVALLKGSEVEGVRTQHVHGDVLVAGTGDADRASADANQLVSFFREGEPPHKESGLRVACTAERTAEGWRFDGMEVTLLWTRDH
ncbi:nuclear transport factor 2 family protein [Streptomyces sp. NPDC049881]|uniref:nuclear transport factor 2 family protein n=1 Tax=Streptomyces sp. NPDC049881 TaxID=3155778 RepID=UPI003438049C